MSWLFFIVTEYGISFVVLLQNTWVYDLSLTGAVEKYVRHSIVICGW